VGANPNLFHGSDNTAGVDQDGDVAVLVYKAAVDRAGGSLQFTDALVQIGATAGADVPGMLRCEAVCNEPDAVYLIFTVPPECQPEGICTLDAFLAKHSAGGGEADQANSNVEFELVRMFQQLFLGLGLLHGVQYCSEIKGAVGVAPRFPDPIPRGCLSCILAAELFIVPCAAQPPVLSGPMDVLVIEATSGDTSAVLLPSFGRDTAPDEMLPPEVLAGAPWAWMGDLWSMGVIMYRAVFGGSPVLMPNESCGCSASRVLRLLLNRTCVECPARRPAGGSRRAISSQPPSASHTRLPSRGRLTHWVNLCGFAGSISDPKCRQLPFESTQIGSRPVIRSPQIQMGCRELLEAGLLQRDPGSRPASHTVTNHWLFQSSRYKMMQEVI